jgi:uncharacterized protein (TIGR02996 family)
MTRKPIAFRTFATDELGFLHAIHEAPRDFDMRRAYSDWLKERDDPLGEFIHLQVLEAETDGKPPRGTKTRIHKLKRQHGMAWRGAPTTRHRRFASGAFFEFFIWGLPDVLLFVGSAHDACSTLDTAFTLRMPHHQLKIIFDIEEGGPNDLRPLLRHPALQVAHSVELRALIGEQANGVPIHGTINVDHLRQAMECLGQRPFRLLFFRGVAPEQRAETERFSASTKATVYCS